ncbi:MAG: DUF1641 domain-containing protein [Planctomycetota bacterium]
MKPENTQTSTIEQVLFERMGVTVEDALASGTDVIDEEVSRAAAEGIDVEMRMGSLLGLLQELTEPENMKALKTLIRSLPKLAEFVQIAESFPNLIATVGDAFDEFQQQCEADGLDLERSLLNGLNAALWLGCQADKDDLNRLGQLLKSDMLKPEAITVVSNAANALSKTQQDESTAGEQQRIGLFGLISVMRKPAVQRAVAFAAKFGEKFGENMDQENT